MAAHALEKLLEHGDELDVDTTPTEIREAIEKLNDSFRLRPVDSGTPSELRRQVEENVGSRAVSAADVEDCAQLLDGVVGKALTDACIARLRGSCHSIRALIARAPREARTPRGHELDDDGVSQFRDLTYSGCTS